LRSRGRSGDRVFVSGTPGDAAAGLAVEQSKLPVSSDPAGYLRKRFLYPSPRVALGDCLRSYASACIDVSDGLLADAGKLAQASGCGAELELASIPISEELVSAVGEQRARELALTGGEDYEICFTVSPSNVDRLRHNLPPERWGYCCIGTLHETFGTVVTDQGNVIEFSHSGWDHFAR
jgi:thiamine-monophosphate kinase